MITSPTGLTSDSNTVLMTAVGKAVTEVDAITQRVLGTETLDVIHSGWSRTWLHISIIICVQCLVGPYNKGIYTPHTLHLAAAMRNSAHVQN